MNQMQETLARVDLVINATPCTGAGADSPFAPEELGAEAVFVDLPYGAEPTPLIAATVARGRIAIDGREVLLIEAQHQFELMTGRRMPTAPARALIEGRDPAAHAAAPAKRVSHTAAQPGFAPV